MIIYAIININNNELVYVSRNQDQAIEMKEFLKQTNVKNTKIVEGRFIPSQSEDPTNKCKVPWAMFKDELGNCRICSKKIDDNR